MADQERETGIIIAIPNEYCDPDHSKNFNVVGAMGKRRRDGFEKASGSAVYGLDFKFPGTLYARIMSCPYANATIKSMDTSKAAALPGVRYVLRYDDEPPTNNNANDSYQSLSTAFAVVPSHGYFEGEPMGVAVCG
jgi:CO/xanthine dehydrogenase Mo-binding subunit